MDYISQNHSKHLIFSCKYRKKLLIRYGKEIKKILCDIAEEKDLNIIEMEVDKDHIHILVQYPPTKSRIERYSSTTLKG
ncbi:IS200/IS605 family transposase [Clostridium tagluense]|nr:IS200/IS605 family transposase [Clostridium tagluense]